MGFESFSIPQDAAASVARFKTQIEELQKALAEQQKLSTVSDERIAILRKIADQFNGRNTAAGSSFASEARRRQSWHPKMLAAAAASSSSSSSKVARPPRAFPLAPLFPLVEESRGGLPSAESDDLFDADSDASPLEKTDLAAENASLKSEVARLSKTARSVKQLKADNDQLNSRLCDKVEEVAALQSQVEASAEEREEMESDRQKLMHEQDTRSEEILQLKTDKEQLNSRLCDKEEEVAALQSQVEASAEEREEMESHRQRLAHKRDTRSQEEISQLGTDNDQLKLRLCDQTVQLAELQSQVEASAKEREEKESDSQRFTHEQEARSLEEISQLKADNDQLNLRLCDQVEAVATLESQVEATAKECEERESDRQRLMHERDTRSREEISQLKADNEQLNSRLCDKVEQVAALQSQVEASAEEREEMESHRQRLAHERDTRSQEEISQLGTDNDQLKLRLCDQTVQLAELQSQVEANAKEREEKESDRQRFTHEQEARSLEEISQLKADNDQLNLRLCDQVEAVATLESQVEATAKECEERESDRQRLMHERDTRSRREEISQLKADNEQLNSRLCDKVEAVAALQAQVEASAKERKEMESDRQRLTSERDSRSQEVSQLKTDNHQLKSRLSDVVEELTALESQVEASAKGREEKESDRRRLTHERDTRNLEEISQLKGDNDQLNLRLCNQVEAVAALQFQVEASAVEREEIESHRQRLAHERDTRSQEEISQLKAANNQLNSCLSDVVEELTALESQVEASAKEREGKESDSQRLTHEQEASSLKEISQLKGDNDQLTLRLGDQVEAVTTLQAKLASSAMELEETESERQRVTNQWEQRSREAKDELQAALVENGSLKARLQRGGGGGDDRSRDREAELEAAQQTARTLKERLRRLQNAGADSTVMQPPTPPTTTRTLPPADTADKATATEEERGGGADSSDNWYKKLMDKCESGERRSCRDSSDC